MFIAIDAYTLSIALPFSLPGTRLDNFRHMCVRGIPLATAKAHMSIWELCWGGSAASAGAGASGLMPAQQAQVLAPQVRTRPSGGVAEDNRQAGR
jgi:hypothetical protein